MKWFVAFFLMCSGVLAGPSLNVPASSWITDASMSDSPSLVSFNLAGTQASMKFSYQPGPPLFSVGTMISDSSDFKGDYLAAGVKAVQFETMGDGNVPAYKMALLTGTSGRSWYLSGVTFSVGPGQWVTNRMPLDPNIPWDTNESGDLLALWQVDLKSVSSVGLRLVQSGLNEQTYVVDKLHLVGPEVAKPLEIRVVDLSNYGFTLEWDCVAQGKYSVYRSTNLLMGFSVLPGGADIVSSDTGVMSFMDQIHQGDVFYKVIQVGP